MTFKEIQKHIKKKDYLFSEHADEEKAKDKLKIEEVVQLGRGVHMNNCYFCIKGKLKREKVDIVRYWGKELVALNDVPALVCQRCGERYFDAKVSQKIEERIAEALKRKTSIQKIDIPVVQY